MREEPSPRVFENRVLGRVFAPKGQEVAEEQKERHDVYIGSRDSSVGTAIGYELES
jgi:hypothetical protein